MYFCSYNYSVDHVRMDRKEIRTADQHVYPGIDQSVPALYARSNLDFMEGSSENDFLGWNIIDRLWDFFRTCRVRHRGGRLAGVIAFKWDCKSSNNFKDIYDHSYRKYLEDRFVQQYGNSIHYRAHYGDRDACMPDAVPGVYLGDLQSD